jgi:hypothetical protein
VAESAARVDAVASKPVPAALVEPRTLAVPELAISPCKQKCKTPCETHKASENPISHQANKPNNKLNNERISRTMVEKTKKTE